MMRRTDAQQKRLAQRLHRARRRLTTSSDAIPRRPSPETLPLSFTQEQFWILDQFDPGNPVYNRPLLLRLSGDLAVDALQQTLNEIVRRHDALRATFLSERGRPKQVIQPPFDVALSMTDLSPGRPEARDEAVRQWFDAAMVQPFELAQGPLLRAELLRLEPNQYLLLLVTQHILFDAWSARLFIREMVQLYDAFVEGRPSPLSDLPIQYADFAHWQRNRFESGQMQKEMDYWQTRLAGAPPYLELPTDHERPKFLSHEGALLIHLFPKDLVAKLKTLSQSADVTLFMTLLAAFKVLLHHRSGQTDIVVGSPVAGRIHIEIEPLIGVLFNTLVLRTNLSGNPTFQALLGRVRQTALEAYAHQSLPFEKLVETLNPPRDLSRTPVFQVMFNFENLADAVPPSQHLTVEEIEFDHHIAYYEIVVELMETTEGLKGLFFYKTDLFEADTVAGLIEDYQLLLEKIVVDPENLISIYDQLRRKSTMPKPSHFSCFIIGGSQLPIHCAESLLARGHTVLGLISDDPVVHDWATENGIASLDYTGSNEALTAFLAAQPFDHLFSIFNPYVLPSDILALPRQSAINYHNGPLPRYGGTHVTSWALINQEKTHGITWHIMAEQVDAGDILAQRHFDIAPDETAISLNVKCLQAMLEAFETLLDNLADDQLSTTPQDLSQRTYFRRAQRPVACGTTNWHKPAAEIDALIRALSFGDYPNPLGLLKIWLNPGVVAVKSAYPTLVASNAPPGTILDLKSESLTVSTASHDLVITELQTLQGQLLSPAALATRFGLRRGTQLPHLPPALAERLTVYNVAVSRYESFWTEKLAHLQPVSLPYPALNRPMVSTGQRNIITMTLPAGLTTWLTQREWYADTFLLTTFATYLSRLSHTLHFDLGFMSANRQQTMTEKAFCDLFTVFVPLSVDLDNSVTINDALVQMNTQQTLVAERQTFPRDLVARYPELRSSKASQRDIEWPIAVMMTTEETAFAEHPALADSDLTLIIPSNGAEPTTLDWAYNPHRFDEQIITRLHEQFLTFLTGLVEAPDTPISNLPLLTEMEQETLAAWNATQTDYPRDTPIHQLFEAQAAQTPETTALIFGKKQLTYGELNRQANQLAHHLRATGIETGDLVALCLERSVEMIVGVLAILKAGGAYVPLDPAYPAKRLAFMLADTQTPLLLTHSQLTDNLSPYTGQMVCVDTNRPQIEQHSIDNLTTEVAAQDLAYVMYTSGSTGQPKGVCVTHRNVVRLVKNNHYADITADEVFLQFAPISFDAATLEIWGPLLNGGRLVIFPTQTSSLETLGQVVEQQQITTLWLTAGLFHQMVDHHLDKLRGLRQLLAGGDVLSVPHVQKVLKELPNIRLINGYGPTENTTFTTCYPMSTDTQLGSSVPIGQPIANTQVYILDPHMQPLPVGVPGELYAGGDGVARGYLNRPELTANRFIDLPFTILDFGLALKPIVNNSQFTIHNSKLYKTGDLARWLPNGNIEFLGRLDHQVKIRGFRIELGEIETILNQHPAVAQCAVIPREDTPGDKRLVAYVVSQQLSVTSEQLSVISYQLSEDSHQSTDNQSLITAYRSLMTDLRQYLKTHLPDYMIPSAFVLLDTLPLNANGKIDRNALPAPDMTRPELAESFALPEGSVEEKLAVIWQDVLKIEKVGRYENFFELGGHSLLATQVTSRIVKTFNVILPLATFFETPTISHLAKKIITVQQTIARQPVPDDNDDELYEEDEL